MSYDLYVFRRHATLPQREVFERLTRGEHVDGLFALTANFFVAGFDCAFGENRIRHYAASSELEAIIYGPGFEITVPPNRQLHLIRCSWRLASEELSMLVDAVSDVLNLSCFDPQLGEMRSDDSGAPDDPLWSHILSM